MPPAHAHPQLLRLLLLTRALQERKWPLAPVRVIAPLTFSVLRRVQPDHSAQLVRHAISLQRPHLKSRCLRNTLPPPLWHVSRCTGLSSSFLQARIAHGLRARDGSLAVQACPARPTTQNRQCPRPHLRIDAIERLVGQTNSGFRNAPSRTVPLEG